MSGFRFQDKAIAALAALLMSSVAVGAAIAPAQVDAGLVKVVTYV